MNRSSSFTTINSTACTNAHTMPTLLNDVTSIAESFLFLANYIIILNDYNKKDPSRKATRLALSVYVPMRACDCVRVRVD